MLVRRPARRRGLPACTRRVVVLRGERVGTVGGDQVVEVVEVVEVEQRRPGDGPVGPQHFGAVVPAAVLTGAGREFDAVPAAVEAVVELRRVLGDDDAGPRVVQGFGELAMLLVVEHVVLVAPGLASGAEVGRVLIDQYPRRGSVVLDDLQRWPGFQSDVVQPAGRAGHASNAAVEVAGHGSLGAGGVDVAAPAGPRPHTHAALGELHPDPPRPLEVVDVLRGERGGLVLSATVRGQRAYAD